MSVLVNGTYWAPSVPRLLTYDDARNLLKTMNRSSAYAGCPSLPHRLLAICDISADTEVIIQYHTVFFPFVLLKTIVGHSCFLNSVWWTSTSQTVNPLLPKGSPFDKYFGPPSKKSHLLSYSVYDH